MLRFVDSSLLKIHYKKILLLTSVIFRGGLHTGANYSAQIIYDYEQKNRNLSLQYLGGSQLSVSHEQRAYLGDPSQGYIGENAKLMKLVNKIRVRAGREGWNPLCQ